MSPPSPQAHAIGERVLGTLRRECLDIMISLAEAPWLVKLRLVARSIASVRDPRASGGRSRPVRG